MKKILVPVMLFLFLFALLVGCGGNPQNKETSSATTPTKTTQVKQKEDADAIYDKIQTGMTFEQVQSLIGKEPVQKTENTADTPAGKVEIKNYSWQVGKSLITVIFENNKVTQKVKTDM